MNKQDVLVVGAGPAGMMAAGMAAQNGAKVTLLERNERVGRKLMITGKGRCNITNACDASTFIASVPGNGRFLYGAIHRFTPQDTVDFFERGGLSTKVERGNRVFPKSDKAVDVVDAMRRFVEKSGVRLLHGRAKKLIIEDSCIYGIETEDGRRLEAGAVIVACGGKSYPLTGSTGDGYALARQAGHTVMPLAPSLVPLVAKEGFCRELQGLSLKNIAVKVRKNPQGTIIYEDFGEMLFTHFGLSGPVILSASAHMRGMEPEKYTVWIDLKPALTIEQLDARLQRDFLKFRNRDFSNSLAELLPKKLIAVAVARSGIFPGTKCNQITREQRQEFAHLLKHFSVAIEGFRPIEEAIVTSGGVATGELNPKTMESKLVKGLYFAGEVIDVDAYTGGFNLQIAFSTGHLAGISAVGGNRT